MVGDLPQVMTRGWHRGSLAGMTAPSAEVGARYTGPEWPWGEELLSLHCCHTTLLGSLRHSPDTEHEGNTGR